MTTRSWLVSQMKSDATLLSLLGTVEGVTADKRIVSSGSIGIPGTTNVQIQRPFVIARANLSGVALAGADRRYLSEPWLLWAHDEPGSYAAKIEPILERLRVLFDRRESTDMGDGQWLIRCDWESGSPDLYDDGLQTATRYASFRLVTRR